MVHDGPTVVVLRALARHLGLHPLAIEDIVHVGQRPKIDSHAEDLLIVVRMLRSDGSERVVVEQLSLRRAVLPVRDARRTVVTGGDGFFAETTRTHLRDTQDHCAQAADVVDACREVTNGLFNTCLSAVGNRTNEIMRVMEPERIVRDSTGPPPARSR